METLARIDQAPRAFDWKRLLGAVAPVLGTAIGGPFGALAGVLVNTALGLENGAGEAERARALERATPEQLLAIQQAERQFALDMERLGVDVLRLDSADRDSARRREAALGDRIPCVLAAGVTLGFFGLLAYLLRHDVPKENAAILNIMLGALGAAWASIISYYFGSSAGSAAKDRLIAGGR